jgi:hypothetical protein
LLSKADSGVGSGWVWTQLSGLFEGDTTWFALADWEAAATNSKMQQMHFGAFALIGWMDALTRSEREALFLPPFLHMQGGPGGHKVYRAALLRGSPSAAHGLHHCCHVSCLWSVIEGSSAALRRSLSAAQRQAPSAGVKTQFLSIHLPVPDSLINTT